MYVVTLRNVSFFAYHGLYPEEAVHGNTFEVDLQIKYNPSKPVHDIGETVDYVMVYEILKTEMAKPRLLLETLAEDVAEKISHSFPFIHSLEISIRKMQPPIPDFSGQVEVRLIKNLE